MANSSIIFAVSLTILVIIVVIIWYLRYWQSKLVSERVRRSPQSYIGADRIGGVYQSPRRGVFVISPPPSFSRALKCPLPLKELEGLEIEAPPPTYDQYLIFCAQQLNNTPNKSANVGSIGNNKTRSNISITVSTS